MMNTIKNNLSTQEPTSLVKIYDVSHHNNETL